MFSYRTTKLTQFILRQKQSSSYAFFFCKNTIIKSCSNIIHQRHFCSDHQQERTFVINMPWRSNGKDNADLINQLESYEVITNPIVKEAMLATDRKFYCKHSPYQDAPQSIGHNVTISAPHMHAYALQLLYDKLQPGGHILDVGSGSGYLTACFARAVTRKCGSDASTVAAACVVGIEHQPELVKLGIENVRADDPLLLENNKIIFIEGDGRLGYPEKAPYDAIHVGAAAPKVPEELLKQLKNGGRMICPVGPEFGDQYLEQFDKDENGVVHKKTLMGVMYVPLTDLRRS